MEDVRLTRDLAAVGLGPVDLRARLASGALHRVRRGAYAESAEADPQRAHRRLLEASLAQAWPGSVVSHGSAAVLHGLPVPRSALQRVHVTRDRASGGQVRRWVQVHAHPLDPVDVIALGGRPVTGLARTVADLACALPVREAVAVGDAALRLGATPVDLETALARLGRRHGVGSARRAFALLDPRSESYGESVSRIVLVEHGRAPTDLQLVVRNPLGEFLGRVDFAWPGRGVIGEFDGRVKYGRELAPGQDVTEVLWREKLREDLIRDLGWQVVRWVWADLDDPRAWLDRLQRALERGHDLRVP